MNPQSIIEMLNDYLMKNSSIKGVLNIDSPEIVQDMKRNEEILLDLISKLS